MASLKSLSVEQMVALVDHWLSPNRARPLLESEPLLAPLLTTLEKARDRLREAHDPGNDTAERLGALNVKTATLDQRFDRKVRGLHNVLTGLIELEDDAERSASYLDLRNVLLPDGLYTTRLSYSSQATAVAQVRHNLTDAHWALAREVAFGGFALDRELSDWLATGEELGEIETQRAELRRRASSLASGHAARDAKMFWVRTVRVLEQMTELAELSTDDVDRILGPLHERLRDDTRP